MKHDWLMIALLALVALAGLAGLLVLAVKRFGRHLPKTAAPPTVLFHRLADAHNLTAAHRRALVSLAAEEGLGSPASYFVSPGALRSGAARLRLRNPAAAQQIEETARLVFGHG